MLSCDRVIMQQAVRAEHGLEIGFLQYLSKALITTSHLGLLVECVTILVLILQTKPLVLQS